MNFCVLSLCTPRFVNVFAVLFYFSACLLRIVFSFLVLGFVLREVSSLKLFIFIDGG